MHLSVEGEIGNVPEQGFFLLSINEKGVRFRAFSIPGKVLGRCATGKLRHLVGKSIHAS